MTKLNGILVANGYLRTPKFEEITALYKDAAKKQNMGITVCYTHEIFYGIKEGRPYNSLMKEFEHLDFVLYLDKDIHLAKNLEQLGIRVFNSSEVIKACDDKGETFQKLSGHGIRMPKTIISPLVYGGTYQGSDQQYVDHVAESLGFPLVIKESFGSFGEQVYLVHHLEELIAKRRELIYKPHLYQEFIQSSFGKDVRINVVGDEVVACMLRTSKDDFRANITNGGSMENWTCEKAFEEMALKVCSVLNADFAGVDILFGEKGEPVLCEVNSNAHIKNILCCTGINVAEAIMSYIAKECCCG